MWRTFCLTVFSIVESLMLGLISICKQICWIKFLLRPASCKFEHLCCHHLLLLSFVQSVVWKWCGYHLKISVWWNSRLDISCSGYPMFKRCWTSVTFLWVGQVLLYSFLNPILFKKIMRCRSIVRVFLKHLSNKMPRLSRDMVWYNKISACYLFVEVFIILTSEWEASTKESKE